MKRIIIFALLTLCLCACQKETEPANSSKDIEKQSVESNAFIKDSKDSSTDYKELSAAERKRLCLSKEDGYNMEKIYYIENSSNRIKNAVSFDIDATECKVYREKRYGSSKIAGATKGYIDSENHFSVKYISNNSSSTIINGSFYDDIWHISENEVSTTNAECEFGDNGEICELIRSKSGVYNKIVVKDTSGKILHEMNINQFEQKNNLKDNLISCSLLGNSKCILFYNEKNKEVGYFVDLNREELIKKYSANFEYVDSIVYGDNNFYILKDSYLKIYSMKNGELSQTIDISNLVDSKKYGKLYEFVKDENDYYSFSNCYNDIKLAVDKNIVYIGTYSGVYKWKEGEKVFHKILDGETTKYYKKLMGTIKIANDGTVYCLGSSKLNSEEHYEAGHNEFVILTN